MKLHHHLGDLYHKHVYRHIAHATAAITDSTDYALSDAFLLGSMAIQEIAAITIGNLAYQSVSRRETPDLSGLLAVFGAVAVTYGGNMIRSPLEQRIGLTIRSKVDKKKDIAYTIEKLNTLSDSPVLSFSQIDSRVNHAIDSMVEEFEGYSVAHSLKTKQSLFSIHLLRRGTLGLMNPFFQESVVTSELFPETIAHEKAHLVGYARESEAEFVGYCALVSSGDRSLEYLGYRNRLRMLLGGFLQSYADLQQLGLNDRTRQELILQDETLRKEYHNVSRYTALKRRFGEWIQDTFLKSTGQGGTGSSYIGKPLRMIASFDPSS